MSDFKEKSNNNEELIALREKVEELENVIANIPGHIYWVNRQNVYLGCNNAQAKILNFTSRAEIVGKVTQEIWPFEPEKVDQINLMAMETNQAFIGEEITNTLEGEAVYLSEKVPLRNLQGEVVGLLGVSFDISDRKRMERELKEAKELAELINQIKTEFIRNMEHDIRTPLCGVIGLVNYLREKENVQHKEFLEDIAIATNELLHYLDNIVEFSQINGVAPMIQQEFNLNHSIQSIFNLVTASASDKGLALKMEYGDKVPHHFMGDRFRIQRILLNLVNNAIKFTPQGYIKVIVSCLEIDQNEKRVKISIEDTGVGIDKKNQEKIFNKFVRGDSANKGIYTGTGLGLWVVKNFVQDLKGFIELQSHLGQGSIFSFSLPLKVITTK